MPRTTAITNPNDKNAAKALSLAGVFMSPPRETRCLLGFRFSLRQRSAAEAMQRSPALTSEKHFAMPRETREMYEQISGACAIA
jgi:hypothetical protein